MQQIILFFLACAGSISVGISLGSCGDPLSVETDRRIIPVNIDSVLLSEPFLSKPTDTLFAIVDGRPISFTSELLRPIFYNENVGNGWYFSVQGITYDLLGDEYELLALRMDDIRTPGTYPMSAPYSLPKRVNPSLSSEYGGRYGQFKEGKRADFITATSRPEGEIRILAIDTTHGVVVGRFHFTAYDATSAKKIQIEDGFFRLHLDPL